MFEPRAVLVFGGRFANCIVRFKNTALRLANGRAGTIRGGRVTALSPSDAPFGPDDPHPVAYLNGNLPQDAVRAGFSGDPHAFVGVWPDGDRTTIATYTAAGGKGGAVRIIGRADRRIESIAYMPMIDTSGGVLYFLWHEPGGARVLSGRVTYQPTRAGCR